MWRERNNHCEHCPAGNYQRTFGTRGRNRMYRTDEHCTATNPTRCKTGYTFRALEGKSAESDRITWEE